MATILLIEDHHIVREGLRMVLELEERFFVIGEAQNGAEALALLETLTPDIILLDLNMPVMDGIGFLKNYRGKTPCIVLTTYNDQHLLVEAVKLGVKSYMLKDAGRATIYEAIDSVLAGGTYFQPAIAQAIDDAAHKQAVGMMLNTKEVTVLKYLAQGYKNSEIAAAMFVSERTVKSYLTVIYEKLAVKSRAQAIAVALEQHYI